MSMSPEKLSHRVLRIRRQTKNGKKIYTLDMDRLVTKDGTTYLSGAPTSDMFVSNMAGMEYDQIEILDAPSVGRLATDGEDKLMGFGADQAVGRT